MSDRLPILSARAGLALVMLVLMASGARASDVAYSFGSSRDGGLAALRVDEARGKLVDHRMLFRDAACRDAMKVRFSPDGACVVMTHESKPDPFLLVAPLSGAVARKVALPAEPDEVRTFGRKVIVTCGGEWVVVVDLESATVDSAFDAEQSLTPRGHGPEDILVTEDGAQAVVSFQKDGKKGKTRGNRLVLFDLPSLAVVSDVQLPRDRPDAHIPGNLKEQGPGPEVLLLSKQADTLLVTLDLYGAVALLDWTGVRAGNPSRVLYLSSALDESWGSAFPDRATLITHDGRDMALVCNAGEDGGAVLVDVDARRVTQRWVTPPGLERPVWLEGIGVAAAACSGKIKHREQRRTAKTRELQSAVYLFDFSGSEPVMQECPQEQVIFHAAHAGTDRPWVVLAAQGEESDELLLFDVDTLRILDRFRVDGRVRKVEAATAP